MKSIKDLERFFEIDLQVKKLIETSRPNLYNSESVEEEEKLLKVVDISRRAINQMVFLSGLDLKEEFDEIVDKIEDKIKKCNYNIDKLIITYENDILKLTKGLEESVEKNIFAYSIKNGVYEPLKYCNTISDMLHYIHFYVLNDEITMQSMNIIDKKEISSDYCYTIYGKENDIAKKIYDNLPNIEEVDIDLVSFDKHIIIIVRNVGHALTIDCQYENDNIRVSYFIPKVCNIEKVNKLIGVKKLDPSKNDYSSPTHGEFVVNRENVGRAISEFIKHVPTDDDIINERSLKDLNSMSKDEVDNYITKL